MRFWMKKKIIRKKKKMTQQKRITIIAWEVKGWDDSKKLCKMIDVWQYIDTYYGSIHQSLVGIIFCVEVNLVSVFSPVNQIIIKKNCKGIVKSNICHETGERGLHLLNRQSSCQ